MGRTNSSTCWLALGLMVGLAACSEKKSTTPSAGSAPSAASPWRGRVRPVAATPQATLGQTGVAAPRRVTALEQLVWGFPKMQPTEILGRLQRLSVTDRSILGSFNQLSTALYLQACRANPRLVFPMGGARFNCARLRADLQQAFRLGLKQQSWRQEVRIQRQKIITSRRCARGEIDRATCARYYKALRRTGAMRQNTGQRIIDNMGNKCQVGIDPGCRY